MSETIYAGFWRRLVAAVLDQIILLVGRGVIYGIITLIVYAVLYLFDIKQFTIPVIAILAGCIFFLDIWMTWIYFALMESSSMMGSLGKLAMGIRVCGMDKRQLTFEEATVRYFAKLVSRLTLMIGYLLAAFSSKKQALHDFIGKSVVVVNR